MASIAKKIGVGALCVVLLAGTSSCATTGEGGMNKQETGTIIGAVLGTAAGVLLGGKAGGAVAGALIGGLIGNQIGKSLDEADQKRLAEATQHTIETGQNTQWSGESGQGTVTQVGTTTEQSTKPVKYLKDKVDTIPPLEAVNGPYHAIRLAKVRSGPGTDYKVVGQLKAGQEVSVFGKVKDQAWYLIGQGDVSTGYVSTNLLAPGGGELSASITTPAGEIAQLDTQNQKTCRIVEQKVSYTKGGADSAKFKACPVGDGTWTTSPYSA